MSEASKTRELNDLPVWIGVTLPLFSVVMLLLAPFLPDEVYYNFFLSETGFIEVATFAFLAIAIVILLRAMRNWNQFPRLLRVWLLLLLLGSIYFAGEEIDWGQVWFEISTPAVIEEVNREKQFSLHKIDSHPLPHFLFNNGPRLAATLGLLFGGIIAIWRRFIQQKLPHEWRANADLLLPTPAVAPVFILAAFSTVPAKIIKAVYAWGGNVPAYLELSLRKPSGEFKEYCIALSILLYVWTLYRRGGGRWSQSYSGCGSGCCAADGQSITTTTSKPEGRR